MKRLRYRCFQLAYTILGPRTCAYLTNLNNPIGKFVYAAFFKRKGSDLYHTNEGIALEISAQEAMGYGFGFLGTYNAFETSVLKQRVRPGFIVIDVGAFLGWYSILLGKRIAPNGKVYAFEPSPRHVVRLKRHIALNRVTNVSVHPMAASNKNGSALFYDAGSGSSLIREEAEDHAGTKIKGYPVTTVTLDSFVKKHKIARVDVIKIDAEGADVSVLQGAVSLLKRKDAPDCMVEVAGKNPQEMSRSAQILVSYMKTFGYSVYDFTGSGLRRYCGTLTTRNLFFSKRTV